MYYVGNELLYENKIKNKHYSVSEIQGVPDTNILWRLAYERARSNSYLKTIENSGAYLKPIKTYKNKAQCVPKRILHVRDNLIVTCANDHTLKTWDFSNAQNPKLVEMLHESELGQHMHAMISDDLMVSGFDDNTLKVLNCNSLNECVAMLKGHKGRVNSMCKLSDRLIASGSDDMTVKIWDWKQEQLETDRTVLQIIFKCFFLSRKKSVL